jgi:hypothetical protein
MRMKDTLDYRCFSRRHKQGHCHLFTLDRDHKN